MLSKQVAVFCVVINFRKTYNIFLFLMIYYLLDSFFIIGHINAQVRSGYRSESAGSIINWPPGSGSKRQDFASADSDPKEIFTDPQHWQKGKQSTD
jgi:hypothetical protein